MAGSWVKHSLRQVMLCINEPVGSGSLNNGSYRFDRDHLIENDFISSILSVKVTKLKFDSGYGGTLKQAMTGDYQSFHDNVMSIRFVSWEVNFPQLLLKKSKIVYVRVCRGKTFAKT